MWFPTIAGTIDRRILVNFNVDQGVASAYLPPPFRPKLFAGRAIVGICLIRLKQIRPKGTPRLIGVSSENGAHRIAVEWDEKGVLREGVFVPRRDTSASINALAGGRVFPGTHRKADFIVKEVHGRYAVEFRSIDGVHLRIEARESDAWSSASVFPDLNTASEFMRKGSFGYSPTSIPGSFHGLELRTSEWHVVPLDVAEVESSFFADHTVFPVGSVRFDGAMLMKGVEHEWHAVPTMKGS